MLLIRLHLSWLCIFILYFIILEQKIMSGKGTPALLSFQVFKQINFVFMLYIRLTLFNSWNTTYVSSFTGFHHSSFFNICRRSKAKTERSIWSATWIMLIKFHVGFLTRVAGNFGTHWLACLILILIYYWCPFLLLHLSWYHVVTRFRYKCMFCIWKTKCVPVWQGSPPIWWYVDYIIGI